MRDIIFFPLAAAALALMAWAAVAPGPARLEAALAPFRDPHAGLVVQGDLLSLFQAPEGLSVELAPLETGDIAARMAAFRPDDQPPFSQGIFITLAPEFSDALAGETVRISVRARSAAENGAPVFGVGYFGGSGRADSGWQETVLARDLRTYEFDWAVPAEQNGDEAAGNSGAAAAIGVWPDPDGRGRMLEMVSLRARILGEGEPPPAVLRGDAGAEAPAL